MFSSQIGTFKKLDGANKRKVLLVLFFCFFFALTAAALFQYAKISSQQSKNNATTNTTDKTVSSVTLVMNTAGTKIHNGHPFSITTVLDSQNIGIDAADFVYTFDPAKLKISSVTPGTFFKSWPVNKIEENKIRLTGIALFENNRIIISKGKAPVSTITFTPIGSPGDETVVLLDPVNTIVASQGKNVLQTDQLKSLRLTIE
jgi:hypothetical protein